MRVYITFNLSSKEIERITDQKPKHDSVDTYIEVEDISEMRRVVIGFTSEIDNITIHAGPDESMCLGCVV